jgi:ABC-type dipeptide/oligopeptide/nickel transport system permease subunit
VATAAVEQPLTLDFEVRPRISTGRRLTTLAARNPLGVLGAFFILSMAIIAIFASQIAPYAPDADDSPQFLSPSLEHPFGTDRNGRDVFSRVVHGARISLGIGVASVFVGTTLGAVIGLVSGFFAGRVDSLIQRTSEALVAIPGLVLLLIILAIAGRDISWVILAIGLGIIPGVQRIVRGAVLSEAQNQYVEAARALGAGNLHIMVRHILPNVLALIVVLSTLLLAGTILIEASLSFLGLGVPPPNPSWGADLSGEARRYFEQAWWMAVFPGLAISITVLGFNLLGDAIRDVLDPKLRGRGT